MLSFHGATPSHWAASFLDPIAPSHSSSAALSTRSSETTLSDRYVVPPKDCMSTLGVMSLSWTAMLALAPGGVQILDCRGKVSGCSGGWPSDAFDLGAALNLQGEDRVAYTGYDRSTPPALCREVREAPPCACAHPSSPLCSASASALHALPGAS